MLKLHSVLTPEQKEKLQMQDMGPMMRGPMNDGNRPMMNHRGRGPQE
jgi:Spy/CpxP family protein refolding chaperone